MFLAYGVTNTLCMMGKKVRGITEEQLRRLVDGGLVKIIEETEIYFGEKKLKTLKHEWSVSNEI